MDRVVIVDQIGILNYTMEEEGTHAMITKMQIRSYNNVAFPIDVTDLAPKIKNLKELSLQLPLVGVSELLNLLPKTTITELELCYNGAEKFLYDFERLNSNAFQKLHKLTIRDIHIVNLKWELNNLTELYIYGGSFFASQILYIQQSIAHVKTVSINTKWIEIVDGEEKVPNEFDNDVVNLCMIPDKAEHVTCWSSNASMTIRRIGELKHLKQFTMRLGGKPAYTLLYQFVLELTLRNVIVDGNRSTALWQALIRNSYMLTRILLFCGRDDLSRKRRPPQIYIKNVKYLILEMIGMDGCG